MFEMNNAIIELGSKKSIYLFIVFFDEKKKCALQKFGGRIKHPEGRSVEPVSDN